MNDDNRSGTTSARRVRSAAALLGGAATLALIGIALGHPADDSVSAARTHHGDTAQYTSPTQTAMKVGLTTVESADPGPAIPPSVPEIPFAAPKIKADK